MVTAWSRPSRPGFGQALSAVECSESALAASPWRFGSAECLSNLRPIPTFGEVLRFRSHLHALVTDGSFAPDGSFIALPELEARQLERLVRWPFG